MKTKGLILALAAAVAVAAAPSAPARLIVVEASITELQRALQQRRVTSRDLVQQYLIRIALYEDRLNAIIYVNPRALEEADDGSGPLVVVDLDVGEPGMVVDDRVHDVDPVAVLAVLASPVTGDTVAGPLETCVLAGVHVQQVAGAGPLVAVGRLPHRPRRPREPRPAEHLPDGRVAEAGRAGDKARPPAGLAAAVTDRGLELGRELHQRAAIVLEHAVEDASAVRR